MPVLKKSGNILNAPHRSVWKLFVFDRNTWYCITVCKLFVCLLTKKMNKKNWQDSATTPNQRWTESNVNEGISPH